MNLRIGSIDTARFIAISLVFYGHFVEQVMYLGNAAAAEHYKWVYAFHMPLFYLLSGVVASERRLSMPTGVFLRDMLRSRLVPYFCFAVAPLAVILTGVPGWFPTVDLAASAGYVNGLISTLMGLPAFNIPLWFLASLIVLELLHRVLGRFWTTQTRIITAIIGFYTLGYVFNRYIDVLELQLIFWMAHAVPLGYAFYLTGILLRRSGWLERSYPTRWVVAAALFGLVVLTLTYGLNQGPFRLLDAVVMMFGTVGHPLLFPLTALVGSTVVILAARLLPRWQWLEHLGEITIIIYGLHGFFYHFVNPPLAAWMSAYLPLQSGLVLGVSATIAVLLSLVIAVPIAIAIERYVPEMAGRKRLSSPAT